MERKLIFLALFLANVQLRSGFRYDQYEEHPSGPQETSKSQPESIYESHPPFGLLNKNRGDKKLGKWVKQRFNSLGSDGGLRRFQKATNSLRRKNFDKIEEVGRSLPDVCRINDKTENAQSLRRTNSEIFNDIDDVDSTLDKKIQKLVWISILQKYKQALGGLHTDKETDADTNKENMKYKMLCFSNSE